MRKLLLAAAALFIVGTSPSMARDHTSPTLASNSWCARTFSNGDNPQCDFSSFRQCQATVSGQGGDCIRNPSLAYDRMRGQQTNNGNSGDWNNRW
jgi:hypothetical protein